MAAGVPMAALPSWQGRAAALTDRHAERDALDRLIEAVRAGESRALVVHHAEFAADVEAFITGAS